MLNKNISIFLIIIVFCLSLCFLHTIEAAEPSRINVDVSKSVGKIPDLFTTGIYLWFLPDKKDSYSLKRFFSDNKLSIAKIPLDVNVFIPSKDKKDIKERLSQIDPYVLGFKKKGARIAILIHSIPSWLSSSKSKAPAGHGLSGSKANFAPPRDYKDWSDLVKTIVHHFNNELKLDAMFIIWSEPDWDSWGGTEEEYFTLYKYAVLGARSADPKAKVGGPGVSSWQGKKDPEKARYKDRPFLRNFLEYCSKNGLKELGMSRLPIDFVELHVFNSHPALWNFIESDVMGWLKEYGFNLDTPLLIGEWSSWEGPSITSDPYSSKDHDTEMVASYVVAHLSAMKNAGVAYHTFTTLYDTDSGGAEEFVGNFGIFTKHRITKASYNVFKMVSMLNGNLIQTSENDPFLYTIASYNKNRKNRIGVIVTNFIPTQKMLKELSSEKLRSKGYTKTDLQKYGKENIMNYLKNGSSKELPEKLKKDLNELRTNYYKYYASRGKTLAEIEILFNNIEKGTYKMTQYLIDSDHSNAYAARDEVKKAMVEIKNAFKAKTIATESLAYEKVDSINDKERIRLEKIKEDTIKIDNPFSCKITLKPYGTMLILLEK